MRTATVPTWRIKAAAQKLCSVLPLGDQLYRGIQLTLGGLRNKDPMPYVEAFRSILEALGSTSALRGIETVEVGTGWNVNLPIALHLCGAGSCFTIDANRYCRPKTAIRSARELVPVMKRELSGDDLSELIDTRWHPLEHASPDSFLETAGITYTAPANAQKIDLPTGSRNLVFSRATLQHVPPDALRGFFHESARILEPGGRIWHRLDLFDQFSMFDRSLSRINYLRYSEEEWMRIASNRYAYSNRLRVGDFARMAEEAGFRVTFRNERVDQRAIAYARSGALHPQFAQRDDRDLGTIAADLVGWLP